MASDSYLTVSIQIEYSPDSIIEIRGLTFPNHSIVGIVGANGAGKTTLLRAITNLQPNQRIIWESPRRLGALIDHPLFNPDWTGRQHLNWTAALLDCEVEEIAYWAAKLEITQLLDRKIASYSLGEKQRLAITRTLLGNPDVLVFDEPTNGLDPKGIALLRTLILELHQQGRNLIVSSHLLAEMESIATHLVVLENGQLRYQGTLSSYVQEGILIDSEEREQLCLLLEKLGINFTQTADGFLLQQNVHSTTVLNQLCFHEQVVLSRLQPYKQNLESQLFDSMLKDHD